MRNSLTSVLACDLAFVALVCVAALLLGIGLNSLRSVPLPLVPKLPEERLLEGLAVPVFAKIKLPGVIELEGAMTAHHEHQAIFLDARDRAFFDLGHIPEARSLPRETFPTDFAAFARQTDKRQRLIVYCSGEDCDDSTVVAKALARLGFENVAIFKGGWEEWSAAGLPKEP